MASSSHVVFHPFAEAFPLMQGAEFDRFVASIKDKGLKNPLIRRKSDGVIVDGRNRYRACQQVGVKVRYDDQDLTEEETIDVIAAQNIERRHLGTSERSALAADYVDRLVECRKGIPCELKPDLAKITESDPAKPGRPSDGIDDALDQASETFNVSKSQIKKARAVKKADPELAEKAKKGEITLNAAEKEIKEKKNPKQAPEVPAVKDGLGNPVDEKYREAFEDGRFEEFRQAIVNLSHLVDKMAKDRWCGHLHAQSIKADLNNAKRAVVTAKPYAVCGYCKGKGCNACRMSGIVSKLIWESTPEEKK